MKHLVTAASLAALALVSLSAGAADPSRRFKSIDVFQLEYADDVQISPDGARIAYVRVSHDIMTDRARRNLWIVDADGSNNRPLRSESKSFASPRWSPDGTRLAYVSAAEGSPQLYVRWMDTGQTALLTNLVQAPGAIAWSPDGKSIAFTQFVPGNKPPLATPPEKPEGASWAPPVKVIDSVVYRADGEGYLDTATGQVATQRQLVEAGIVASDEQPKLPWHRIQGTRDASTMWFAVMRKREKGVFIGTLVLRHSSHYASLLDKGWEEVDVGDIAPHDAS
ncbi:MAG TPA: hypothetical protein VF033_09115 [Steroidobacteraceae bacterium]